MSNSNSNLNNLNLGNNNNNNNNNNFGQQFNNLNSNCVLQTLKRRTNKVVVPLDGRVTLEKAYGFTINSNTRLTQSADGTIAYLAGCVIVLYDSIRQTQEFIISQARKTLTTLAFSADGRCIATGESGHDPRVRVWDVREKVQICEFAGHKFSIECVCFSSSLQSPLLVSIGNMHDMVVNVWNVRTRFKVASNKVACKVRGMAFSRDGSYFVTVGNRHVKFWYLTVSSLMETVPIKGRAAILGDLKNNYFCDVACGQDICSHLTYSITTNGILCEFNEQRSLSRAIELQTERAYCIYANSKNLFIGCSNGAVLIFRQHNLEMIAALPRPHPLGVDVAKGLDTRHLMENLNNHGLKYPDCVAICYDKSHSTLSAIYNDHSFYAWDIKDLTKVKKLDSHLYHSSCCWSLDIYTSQHQMSSMSSLPFDSFITCSTDNTLRIWSSVSSGSNSTVNTPQSASLTTQQSIINSFKNNSNKLKQNIYSKELLKIIYIDNDLTALCDIDQSIASGGNGSSSTSASTDNNTVDATGTSSVTNLPISSINLDNGNGGGVLASSKLGARCIKINPYGTQLATGDRNGNIKIFDLSTLESVCLIEAHDGEVLYLQYSPPESSRLLLASSSRDRLIHIFDASKITYDLLQTLDDHSAAITAVRFSFNQYEKQLYVISCGADKSIMFRTASVDCSSPINFSSSSSSSPSPNLQNQQLQFVRSSYVAEKQTFYDLNLDTASMAKGMPPTQINTISQDRMIRSYSIKDGKKVRQFRGSLNEDGYLLKMDTDRTGNLIATSCTDKCVYVWDVNSCECVAYIYGHSEVVTDLKFTNDNQHLITVSGDGCIFVWRLNNLPFQSQQTNLQQSCSNNQNAQYFPTATQTTTSTSWSTRKSSLQASRPITHLLQRTSSEAETILTSSTSTNVIENLFSDENEHEMLPAWARNKLLTSSGNTNVIVAATASTSSLLSGSASYPSDLSKNQFENHNDNELTSASATTSPVKIHQPDFPMNNFFDANNEYEDQKLETKTARRSRAVWGPVPSETSFAIMVESHNSIDANTTHTPNSILANTSLTAIENPNGNNENCDMSALNASTSSTSSSSSSSSLRSSPQQSESHMLLTSSSKLITNTDVDLLNDDNMNTTSYGIDDNSSSSATITKTEEFIVQITTTKDQDGNTSSSSQYINIPISTTTSAQTKLKANSDSSTPQSTLPSFSSNRQHFRLFEPTLAPIASSPLVTTALLNNSKINTNSRLTAEQHPLKQSKDNEFMSSQLNEDGTFTTPPASLSNSIKLDCDMDNSFRRQSISARFLMKTQQLQQQQQSTEQANSQVKSNINSSTINTPILPSFSTNSITSATNVNSSTSVIASVQQQLVADHLKIKRKTSLFNNFAQQQQQATTSTTSGTSPIINSTSFSKQKLSLCINTANENNLNSNDIVNSRQSSTSSSSSSSSSSSILKRSPSATSLISNESFNSNSNKPKVSNNSTVDNKQSQQDQDEEKIEDNSTNLKKAISMVSLLAATNINSQVAKQQNGNKQNSTASSSSSSSAAINEPQNNSSVKKVRQVKQRSVERQLTSSSILSHIALNHKQQITNQTSNNKANSLFSSNNKQLSNSTQNLNKLAAQAALLAPSVSSATHKPSQPNNNLTIRSINFLKPTQSTSNKVITSSNQVSHKPMKHRNTMGPTTIPLAPTPPPLPVSQSDLYEQMIQAKKSANTSKERANIMTSSGSSNNSDINDLLVINTNGNQIINEDANANKNNNQTSSNSLTSSSSSSCSLLFDNDANNNMSNDKKQHSIPKHSNRQQIDLDMLPFNPNSNLLASKQHNSPTTTSSINNSNNNGYSSLLKKPITFASIAASTSSNIINPISPSTNSNVGTNSSNGMQKLTNDKIQSILNEFKQNIIYLEHYYQKESKSFEEYLSSLTYNNLANQPYTKLPNLHRIQTFNTAVSSIMHQFQLSTTTNTTTATNNPSKLNLNTLLHHHAAPSTSSSSSLSSNINNNLNNSDTLLAATNSKQLLDEKLEIA